MHSYQINNVGNSAVNLTTPQEELLFSKKKREDKKRNKNKLKSKLNDEDIPDLADIMGKTSYNVYPVCSDRNCCKKLHTVINTDLDPSGTFLLLVGGWRGWGYGGLGGH